MLFALPGVPSEMRAMFDGSVRPAIQPFVGTHSAFEINLHCFGISEAALGDRVADLMARERNPLVGTTASNAIFTI